MDPQITQLQKAAATREDVIGLAGGLPAEDLLPREALAKAFAAEASRDGALQYGWPEGTEQVRQWVAGRLRARGATVDADRVIITAGAQQALAIAGQVLAGKSITVGDATYPGALDAFRRAGVSPVARDGDVTYVMAGVANPLGRALPVDTTRLALADEAYTELRFDGATPPPLVNDQAWHVGTISKTIAPGLRIGWLIPPAAQHAEALEIKAATDLQTASITQAALGRMLQSLDYDALLVRARTEYARRADALVTALRRHVPAARFTEPEGGFSIWVETDRETDEVGFLEAALAAGVMVDPGSAFRIADNAHLAMRLSFSSAPIDRIAEGARRLARALK